MLKMNLKWSLIIFIAIYNGGVGGNQVPAVVDHSQSDANEVEQHGHSDSIIRFSYDDTSDRGPKNWMDDSIGEGAKEFSKNACPDGWVTPLNIETHNVVAPEEDTLIEDETDDSETKRSLTIFIPHPGIEYLNWEFGHPADAYHGLEVRSPNMGIFQLHDRFDYIGQGLDMGWTGINEFTNYDFTYASIFYCDPDKAGLKRSMHQIDGQRFPLEIDLIFFNQPAKIGYDHFVCQDKDNGDCFTVGVMVAVIGEFGDEDNQRLQPLIDAAGRYEGPDFGSDDQEEDYVIPIQSPWSPTWLIPETSDYYYYDEGSFPVPPCWPVTRVYVIKERIKISRRQLNVLASVRTKREPTSGGRMPCTYSMIQEQPTEDAQEIKYNQNPYDIKGTDNRPMTDEDIRQKEVRDKKAADLRKKANARKGIFETENLRK